MEKSINMGMQTFDYALFKLYQEKKISLEEALKNADSENNLRLKVKLASEGAAGAPAQKSGLAGLSLQNIEEDKPEPVDRNADPTVVEPGSRL
jgi:twitching motility protein PilU